MLALWIGWIYCIIRGQLDEKMDFRSIEDKVFWVLTFFNLLWFSLRKEPEWLRMIAWIALEENFADIVDIKTLS